MAYSTANTAVCASSARRSGPAASAGARPSNAARSGAPDAVASSGYTSSRRSAPSTGRARTAHSSKASRNAGSVSYSPRPMSTWWSPVPGNRNTVLLRSPGGTRTPSAAVTASNAESAAARSSQTTGSRWSSCARPTRRVCATSASVRSSCSASVSRSRWARAARAAPSAALSRSSCACALGGGVVWSGGTDSSTTCTFVPDQPNELTPAMRGPPAGHATDRSGSSTGQRAQSMAGLRSVRCRLAGTTPCRTASTALTSPATPAAPSRCPRLVLTAPSTSGRAGSRSCANTSCSAETSTASPSAVPEPCVST